MKRSPCSFILTSIMTLHKVATMLDFDGVLLRNRGIQKYIGHKCTEYLAKRTGLSYAEAKKTNDARYPLHGHTALVLERDFGMPTNPKEFNAGVYDSIDYDRVRAMLTRQDVAHSRVILQTLNIDLSRTFLFTNAPRRWIRELREVLELPFEDYRILGSDVLGHFKPGPRAYAEAEFFVRLTMPDVDMYWLIDDSVQNVRTAMVLPRWKGTLYD